MDHNLSDMGQYCWRDFRSMYEPIGQDFDSWYKGPHSWAPGQDTIINGPGNVDPGPDYRYYPIQGSWVAEPDPYIPSKIQDPDTGKFKDQLWAHLDIRNPDGTFTEVGRVEVTIEDSPTSIIPYPPTMEPSNDSQP